MPDKKTAFVIWRTDPVRGICYFTGRNYECSIEEAIHYPTYEEAESWCFPGDQIRQTLQSEDVQCYATN